MPAIQTLYPDVMAAGVPGLVADASKSRLTSYVAEASPVPFGVPVFQGAKDNTCVIAGTANAGPFVGISVIGKEVRPLINEAADTYPVGSPAAVMEEGHVWVKVTSAVTPRAVAYIDASGNFTATETGNTVLPETVFLTTAAAGGIARIGVRVA